MGLLFLVFVYSIDCHALQVSGNPTWNEIGCVLDLLPNGKASYPPQPSIWVASIFLAFLACAVSTPWVLLTPLSISWGHFVPFYE